MTRRNFWKYDKRRKANTPQRMLWRLYKQNAKRRKMTIEEQLREQLRESAQQQNG